MARAQVGSRFGHHGYSRRQVVKGAGALGLSLATFGGAARFGGIPGVSAQDATIQLFHDKANWDEFYQQMGELAAAAGGPAVETVPYSDTTSYQQTIQSSLPTDDAPSVFTWWSGYRMEALYQEGSLLDVSALWQQAIEAGYLPETLATAFTFEEKQWGMPNHVSHWPVFYNKTVFDANAIAVPTTWDELMAAAETLKGAGVTPFYATVDGRWPAFIWFEDLLIRTDPDFYEALMRGEQSYTDPVVVGVMEVWKEMFDREYFTALDIPLGEQAAGMFANGEIGMILNGTWLNQQFPANGMTPGEDYGVFILPNVNPDLQEKVIIFETGPFLVPSNVENPEAAQAFLTWWVSPEAQTEWSRLLQDVPSNPQATSESPVLSDLVAQIDEGGYRLIQRYWEATPPQIVENAVDELGRFMLNPGEYMSVLETIQGLAEAEWSNRQ
ncbi:MAG: ABC transporter substrate-binding protein [Thermomicrobiales bacterium]